MFVYNIHKFKIAKIKLIKIVQNAKQDSIWVFIYYNSRVKLMH
jgi:hypothetical protein